MYNNFSQMYVNHELIHSANEKRNKFSMLHFTDVLQAWRYYLSNVTVDNIILI